MGCLDARVACAPSGTAVGGFNEAAHCEPHLGYRSPDGAARRKGRRTIRLVISRLQPTAVPATAVFSAGAGVRTTRIGRVSAAPVALLRTTTAPHAVCGAPAPSAVRGQGPGAPGAGQA